LRVPFMAGSSVPLTWRKPSLTLPMKSVLQGAVQIGYGPFEGYGYHALEGMQSAVERRLGGETGVAAVTCLQGEKMWQPFDANPSLKAMLDSGMKHVTAHAQGDFRKIAQADKQSASWLIEYRDGLKAVVAMLNGWVHEGDGGAFIFAGQVKNQPISAWQFYLQQPDPFAHFAYQIAAFEAMVRTGQAPYPIERTLLTTGILDAVMISQAEGNRRVETPYLNFAYAPTDWPFATDPIPLALPSR